MAYHRATALALSRPRTVNCRKPRLRASALTHAALAARKAALDSGSADPARDQNRQFSDALTTAGIPHKFFLLRGGHTWAAWRREAAQALLVATTHLRG